MPPVALDDGFSEIGIQFYLGSDPTPMLITFGAYGETPTVALMNTLHAAYKNRYNALQSSGYILRAVGGRWWSSSTDQHYVESTATPVAMGMTGLTLPSNCAYVIRKRTSLAGRRHRGRFYIPGVAEASADERGTVLAATLTALNSASSAWLSDFESAMGQMAILHRDTGSGTVVSTLTANAVIGTQRRRMKQTVYPVT